MLGNFQITQKLSEAQIRQLVDLSKNDPDIQKFTRDPKRFKDEAAVKEFIDKTQIYALIHEDQLRGIIWFSHKNLPERNYTKDFDKSKYNTTFAIRLYDGAKGKGLATPFMKEAFTRLQDKKGQAGIWLETLADNTRAIRLYKKFGFEQVTESDQNNRIVMMLAL